MIGERARRTAREVERQAFIDEIYSIVEFLDPQIFAPLFRFNREFYELDDRGRPAGYRNLDELRRRLRPLLLRRRWRRATWKRSSTAAVRWWAASPSNWVDPERIARCGRQRAGERLGR